jgi:cytochrome c556
MRALPAAVAPLALVLAVAAVVAQQPPAAPAPGKPLVPVAASTLAADPAPYVGQHVTLFAPVEQRVSPAAFSVDQDRSKPTGQDVLILTRALFGTVVPDAYVTVIGEVVTFDAAEIGQRSPDFLRDLPADAAARFAGRAAVLATAVIDAAMVDLTKKAPPPPTPEEIEYDALMKRINPAFNLLRQGVSSSSAEAILEHVVTLRKGFAEAEAFWKARGRKDAVGFAQEGRKQLEALHRAAAAANWDDVKAAATALGQSCQKCHTVYRERLDDGTSRIRGQ